MKKLDFRLFLKNEARKKIDQFSYLTFLFLNALTFIVWLNLVLYTLSFGVVKVINEFVFVYLVFLMFYITKKEILKKVNYHYNRFGQIWMFVWFFTYFLFVFVNYFSLHLEIPHEIYRKILIVVLIEYFYGYILFNYLGKCPQNSRAIKVRR